ncbi:two-component system response regulator YesN [Paenibacillus castaneae]|uniref:response regulator n=1 Tax=Paenibacillus castaneae TaxID=474957 RepID=UPI000C99D581|nr:response regulator [Paenibacillus castaneae]NIK77701.1 two-component system response regulator YesN [Paenibacillus castaneae]
MFQVLLVDDEPLARNNLWTLVDFRKHGFEICGEAHNGVMALAMIEQSPPHIAIIDVNMPEMNGVELNRTIKERYPAIKTIMLSSFDDYDYVRDCLKNGSIDYFLKHRLDGATLIGMLNKAVLELQQEDRLLEDRNDQKAMAERMNPVLIRGYIADLVRGKPQSAQELEAFARKNGLYPQTVSYAAASLQIVPFLLLTQSCSDVQTNRLVQQAVEIMQQSLGDIQEHTAAYLENGRLVVVFSFKERSEHAAASEAGRLMSKLRHALELFLNLKCVYAVGHLCSSLSRIGESYGAAERLLDFSPAEELTGQVAGWGSGVYGQRVSLTIEEQKQLLLSIEMLDEEGVQRLISSVFDSIRMQPVHSHSVQMIISDLLHIGDKVLKKGMPQVDSAMDKLPARSELGTLDSVGKMELWLQSFYASLLSLLKETHAAGPYSRHVSQAIVFILEKYSGIVTLELAAGAIGLNSSYLSRIFKEETRTTFSEYVNRVRIDAARKLLGSGQYSIKQISNLAGFATYNYFFKVFKEMTGVTPQAYLNGLVGGGSEARS